MKYCLYALFYGGLAWAQSGNAQSDSTLYSVDLNGHVVSDARYIARDGDKSQLNQSLNGREVPLQTSEVHMLTDEPNHRVTETFVRKYDGTGQLMSTERTLSDETKRPGGSTIRATVFRSDLNGSMSESERRIVEAQVSGATTTAAVTISRAGLSGSFDTAEKRQVVTVANGDTTRETESISRPSGNGSSFYEAAREVREETRSKDKTTSSRALYELDYQNNMALSLQNVSTTTQSQDGTQVTRLDTYAPSVYGIAREGPPSSPKLREQETIVRREIKGVVTETTTVSRPTMSDPNRLGEPGVISTLVCTGACAGPLQASVPKP